MRYKYKKRKKVISISIDEDLYYESGEYIENLSRYLNQCLRNAVDTYKRKNEKEAISEEEKRLRIIDNMTTEEIKKLLLKKQALDEEKEIVKYNWVNQ